MDLHDYLAIAGSNLRRMKLRSSLTILGVIIGIAALVSMMSFGAGMQKNVLASFQSLELFNSLQVLSSSSRVGVDHTDPDHDPSDHLRSAKPDSGRKVKLDDAAIAEISRLPGVRSVYPEETFAIRVKYGAKSTNTTARSLPTSLGDLSAYNNFEKGRFFSADTAHEVVVGYNLMQRLGVNDPDSLIGQEIELISAKVSMSAAMGSLMGGGRINPFVEISYPFRVCGVLKSANQMGPYSIQNLLLPLETARSMEKLSFSNPYELLSQADPQKTSQYNSLNVRLESLKYFEAVRDSLEALGYNTFSFADFFEELKKGFLIFDAVLGAVGFIALIVAALGIVNTMVMSILERYREIGVLKSLGADNRDIRILFLLESGVIGILGAVGGLLLGWIITRVGSVIAKYYMAKEGAPNIELFDLPFWLIALALLFGLVVSLAAGWYPAARAARVDPVKALRHD